MKRLTVLLFTLITTIIFLTCSVNGDHPEKEETPERTSLTLSKKLQRLLSAEMNSVQHGMTNLSIAIPAGDWNSIAETAKLIKDGYIMEKKLSNQEMKEFQNSLPSGYSRIDQQYKKFAMGMIDAAKKEDAKAVNTSFYRLNSTCIECHVKYAKERFPGFK